MEQRVPEANARPKACGEPYQQVVPLGAWFPWGQADLERLVFVRYVAWGQILEIPSRMRTLRSSGEVSGVQVIIQMVSCAPSSSLGCQPLQCSAFTSSSRVKRIGRARVGFARATSHGRDIQGSFPFLHKYEGTGRGRIYSHLAICFHVHARGRL